MSLQRPMCAESFGACLAPIRDTVFPKIFGISLKVRQFHTKLLQMSYGSHWPCSQASPVFCPLVCIQYNTWKRKSSENGKGLGTFITRMKSGGCEVDEGGRGLHSK